MFAIGGSNFQGAASQCIGMKHSNIKKYCILRYTPSFSCMDNKASNVF